MGQMVGGCREGRVGETQWRDEKATRLRRMSQTQQVKRATTVLEGRLRNRTRSFVHRHRHTFRLNLYKRSHKRSTGLARILTTLFQVDVADSKYKQQNKSICNIKTKLGQLSSAYTHILHVQSRPASHSGILSCALHQSSHSALSSLISANLLLIAFSVLVGGTFLDTNAPTNAINPPNRRTQATPFLS